MEHSKYYNDPDRNKPIERAASSGALTHSELDFVRMVMDRPGCKLNGEGEAVVWTPEYFPRWQRPDELGYIKSVGSYKWVITVKGARALAGLPEIQQSTGMRCTICCAKAGEPHVPGCSEAPVPPIAVQDAMMALDADRARRWLARGPDRRQQQTELVPNMRQGADRRKA
jgi:hypothetical protein